RPVRRRARGAAHPCRVPPGPTYRVVDRRLRAATVAAGGAARAGARHTRDLRAARPPPGADGDRVHDPDALPRRPALPPPAVLGFDPPRPPERHRARVAGRPRPAGDVRPVVSRRGLPATVARPRLL